MDVVVIGAGLAGLACAFRLQRRGFEVMVLERERAAGGRARGECVVAAADAAVQALAREAGVALAPCGDGLHVVDGDALVRWDGAFAPPASAELHDAESAAQALARSAGVARVERELAPLLLARCGAEAEQLAAGLALRELAVLAKEPRLLRVAGGGVALARALAREVDLRVGFEVTALETDVLGVDVRYVAPSGERRVRASAAVLAAPPEESAALAVALTASERELLSSLRRGRELAVAVELDPSPLGERGGLAVFARAPGSELAALWQEPARDDGRAAARVVLRPAAADALWAAGDARVLEAVRQALAAGPFARSLARAERVVRTPRARPLFPPGSDSTLAAFHARATRTPRIALAGGALEAPTAEGAVTSGLAAADEIARALD